VESTETNAIKHFTDLRVWQKAHELFVSINRVTEKVSLGVASTIVVEQLLKSTGSISANIAEGFNSHRRKKYVQYLDVAQCSAAETENWLYKVVDCVLLEKTEVQPWLETSVIIQKMLSSMITKLEKRKDAKPQPFVSSPSLPHMPFKNRHMFRD
jgi:four helix bundle protein